MKLVPLSAVLALVASMALVVPARSQNAAPSFLLGSAAATTTATRTIALDAGTRWVNVRGDEVVRFTTGSTEFAWRFDGPGGRSFDLRAVAPAGALAQAVTVYVQVKVIPPAR